MTTNWTTKYDPSINQVYYINSDDGSVSFDLPCEVQSSKTVKPTLLKRITSKLSLCRSKSPLDQCRALDVAELSVQPQLPAEPTHYVYEAPVPAKNYTAHLAVEDAYMLEEPLNLYNSDVSSISSDESIQSFYLELPHNEIYFDHEHSVYYDQKSLQVIEEFYDKEQERMELRLQLLKELY